MTDIAALDLERRVERLLDPWDRPGAPGATIAVLRDGAFVLRRHVGLASIELDRPIDDATCFRVASVTKQFTCAAILMLAAAGKLAVEEAARQYLPELPDYGAAITIDHLMRNTSGLRDMLELMRLGGLDLTQPCRPEDLLSAICRQRGLNFAPGTRFLYSNTNFLLLGMIVERIAGQALPEFLETRIFAPLGMGRTRLARRTDEVIPGLADGYLARAEAPGGFVRAQHAFPLAGEGGLVSSVEDLALWDRNFATARAGGRAVVAGLDAQESFANGTENAYARGLEVQRWRGLRTVAHGGLWPGFKTLFLRVPDKRLTVIAIANVDAVDVHALGYSVLDAVLVDEPGMAAAAALPPLEAAAGRYLDRERAATLELSLAPDGRPVATMNGLQFPLVATADGRLAAHRGAFPFTIAPARDGSRVAAELDAGIRAVFHRVGGSPRVPAELAGHYVNDEIAAQWTVAMTEEGAEITVAGPLVRSGPWRVEAVEGDFLRIWATASWLRTAFDARIRRDDAGAVTGLEVSGGRVKAILFRRRAG